MRQKIRLGPVQETLLIPLYGRAVESRKRRPLLRDPLAGEIVAQIDYDFARWDGTPSLFGSVLRTAIFDEWVKAFMAGHPGGTVVEMGAGLNTRFERLDDGKVHWLDIDLADVVELRRRFFAESGRRRMLAASLLSDEWIAAARELPGPYFFAIEAVLLYLEERDVREALGRIARTFPGAQLAFDTGGRFMVDRQDRHDTLRGMEAEMRWACDAPRELESWGFGLRLLESRTFASAPDSLRPRIPFLLRTLGPLLRRRQIESYRFNRFEAG